MNRMAALSKPPELPLDIPAIAELAGLRQWVCWRAGERDGKMTKIPVQPSGINASTTNPHTWATLEACQAAVGKSDIRGVGFVFTRSAGIVGTDLDHCRNAVTGAIDADAQAVVDDLRSYTEVSQSVTGLHILCRGTLPTDGGRHGEVEVYGHGRYFVMTGQHLPGTVDEIQESQAALERLWATRIRPGQSTQPEAPVATIVKAEFPWGKFHASLTNDREFQRTWERKRDRELKDGSLSTYDLALAVRAVMMGWDDGEIAALIWAFRGKEYSTEKLDRPDYLPKFVIGKASDLVKNGHTSSRLVDEEEHTREEAGKNSDSARRGVYERLGVDIERFIQVGKDPSTYFAVIEGREVRIGGETDLLAQAKVRSRLMAEAGIIIQPCKQIQWDTVIRCLLAMREVRAVEEGDFFGRVRGFVDYYLAKKPPIDLGEVETTKGDVIADRHPFIEGEWLFINAPSLIEAVSALSDFRMASEIRSWLSMAGGASVVINEHSRRRNKSICRSYWRFSRHAFA